MAWHAVRIGMCGLPVDLFAVGMDPIITAPGCWIALANTTV